MTRRRPTFAPRKCLRCGAEFMPASATHRYCSATCKKMSQKKASERNREAIDQAKTSVAALSEAQKERLRVLLSDQRQHSDEIFIQLGDEVLIRA